MALPLQACPYMWLLCPAPRGAGHSSPLTWLADCRNARLNLSVRRL
jgi:hypothetical protein